MLQNNANNKFHQGNNWQKRAAFNFFVSAHPAPERWDEEFQKTGISRGSTNFSYVTVLSILCCLGSRWIHDVENFRGCCIQGRTSSWKNLKKLLFHQYNLLIIFKKSSLFALVCNSQFLIRFFPASTNVTKFLRSCFSHVKHYFLSESHGKMLVLSLFEEVISNKTVLLHCYCPFEDDWKIVHSGNILEIWWSLCQRARDVGSSRFQFYNFHFAATSALLSVLRYIQVEISLPHIPNLYHPYIISFVQIFRVCPSVADPLLLAISYHPRIK